MSRYELEQRLENIQAQQRALAVEAARIQKFLKQRTEMEQVQEAVDTVNSMIPK